MKSLFSLTVISGSAAAGVIDCLLTEEDAADLRVTLVEKRTESTRIIEEKAVCTIKA